MNDSNNPINLLVDTHCHIHEPSYPLDTDEVLVNAREAGVGKLICVGTSLQSSHAAVDFTAHREGVFAAIGIHPHEADDTSDAVLTTLEGVRSPKLVAIGEIGLDYHYSYGSRERQLPLFERQLQLAVDRNLPVIFHVREAFEDFWPVLANFSVIRGVLHSFTDTQTTLEKALGRGLYIGVNGISTFTKDPEQQSLFANIPLESLLLETDAPYLTPPPLRGKINQSAYVRLVASYHAKSRGISEDRIATTTTANAEALFRI